MKKWKPTFSKLPSLKPSLLSYFSEKTEKIKTDWKHVKNYPRVPFIKQWKKRNIFYTVVKSSRTVHPPTIIHLQTVLSLSYTSGKKNFYSRIPPEGYSEARHPPPFRATFEPRNSNRLEIDNQLELLLFSPLRKKNHEYGNRKKKRKREREKKFFLRLRIYSPEAYHHHVPRYPCTTRCRSFTRISSGEDCSAKGAYRWKMACKDWHPTILCYPDRSPRLLHRRQRYQVRWNMIHALFIIYAISGILSWNFAQVSRRCFSWTKDISEWRNRRIFLEFYNGRRLEL